MNNNLEKFEKALDKAHEMEFDKFKFDEPDYNALIVTEENFFDMLQYHPAGVTYYGTVAKKWEAEYDEMEKRYKARYAEMYDVAGARLRKSREKDNQKNIESMMGTMFGDELEQWNKKLSELRAMKDATAMYFEGWKAKGPILAAIKELVVAGLWKIDPNITENDVERVHEKQMNLKKAEGILGNSHQRLMGGGGH